MEVPGIAPGSANPSPLVSTCVFKDQISPATRLLDGLSSASHWWLSPSRLRSPWLAAETSPNYRRSLNRLGRAAQGTGYVVTQPKPSCRWQLCFFPVFYEVPGYLGTLPQDPKTRRIYFTPLFSISNA